jgi:glutamate-1-semialdehyde 2,1-aminomutase
VDGNVYLDYLLGQGPLILGHCPTEVVEAVGRVLHQGQLYGGQHEREIVLSQRLCEIVPCAELVRFGSSGTEMVQAALRLARAYTGRDRVLKFEGHYHGWLDNVLVSVSPPLDQAGPRESPHLVPGSKGQDPAASANMIVRPWNDAALLRAAFEAYGENLAAVIMEPMMCNTHAILPQPGYLEEARRLCDAYGVVLIFDEIVTGFRLGLNGAQGRFGVTPDLAVFGKAMAAGFPVSCLVGRKPLMELIARGEVVHAGTFNTNLVVMAAAEATTTALSRTEAKPYETMARHGEALMAGIREIGCRLGVPLLVEGLPTAFAVAFTERPAVHDYREYVQYCDRERYTDLALALLARGVHVASRGIWYLSTVHTAADIEETLEAVEDALRLTFARGS